MPVAKPGGLSGGCPKKTEFPPASSVGTLLVAALYGDKGRVWGLGPCGGVGEFPGTYPRPNPCHLVPAGLSAHQATLPPGGPPTWTRLLRPPSAPSPITTCMPRSRYRVPHMCVPPQLPAAYP